MKSQVPPSAKKQTVMLLIYGQRFYCTAVRPPVIKIKWVENVKQKLYDSFLNQTIMLCKHPSS